MGLLTVFFLSHDCESCFFLREFGSLFIDLAERDLVCGDESVFGCNSDCVAERKYSGKKLLEIR
jgi:hypothetical protein